MKHIFTMCLVVLLGLVTAEASTITGNVQDVGGIAAVTNVTFKPISTPLASTPTIFLSVTKTATTDTNGNFSIVLVQGSYQVTVGGNAKDSIVISVPNDNASYNWVSLRTDTGGNYTLPLSPLIISAQVPLTNSFGKVWDFNSPAGSNTVAQIFDTTNKVGSPFIANNGGTGTNTTIYQGWINTNAATGYFVNVTNGTITATGPGTTRLGSASDAGRQILIGNSPGWGDSIHLVSPAGIPIKVWDGSIGGYNGSITVRNVRSDSGNNTGLILYGNVNAGSGSTAVTVANLIAQNDTDRLFIAGSLNVTSGGSVGIGTNAPASLLDVTGTLTVRGNQTNLSNLSFPNSIFAVDTVSYITSIRRAAVAEYLTVSGLRIEDAFTPTVMQINALSGYGLDLVVSGTRAVHVTGSGEGGLTGSVGINNLSAKSLLDVNGSATIRGVQTNLSTVRVVGNASLIAEGFVQLQANSLTNTPPAAGASMNGTILIETTGNTLIYYSGGLRYKLTGTSF